MLITSYKYQVTDDMEISEKKKKRKKRSVSYGVEHKYVLTFTLG